MFDFSSYYDIAKSVAIQTAKAIHKPSLNDVESMKKYQQAVGINGKACYDVEQKDNMMIEFN